jgi:hypothetical protein
MPRDTKRKSFRRPANPAFADALLKTESGRHIVFEARHEIKKAEHAEEVKTRIRQLKDLAYHTFAGDFVPMGQHPDRNLYLTIRDARVYRELGIQGGEKYEHALAAVKRAWMSPLDCKYAIKLLTEVSA